MEGNGLGLRRTLRRLPAFQRNELYACYLVLMFLRHNLCRLTFFLNRFFLPERLRLHRKPQNRTVSGGHAPVPLAQRQVEAIRAGKNNLRKRVLLVTLLIMSASGSVGRECQKKESHYFSETRRDCGAAEGQQQREAVQR